MPPRIGERGGEVYRKIDFFRLEELKAGAVTVLQRIPIVPESGIWQRFVALARFRGQQTVAGISIYFLRVGPFWLPFYLS